MNENAIPFQNQRIYAFLREEKHGYWSFKLPGMVGYDLSHIMNRTAREIFDLCNGRNSVLNICSILSSRYNSIPIERIKTDLNIACLQLTRTGAIKWKMSKWRPKSGFIESVSGKTLVLCDDESSLSVLRFLQRKNAIDINFLPPRNGVSLDPIWNGYETQIQNIAFALFDESANEISMLICFCVNRIITSEVVAPICYFVKIRRRLRRRCSYVFLYPASRFRSLGDNNWQRRT